MYISKKICAVLMKEMSNAKAYYLAVHWRKEVNISKIGRFRYEMIG